jgi:hypothetical protein
MRRAARVDLNQRQTVRELTKLGFSVAVIGRPVDLLIGKHGMDAQVELKTPHHRKTAAGRVRDEAKNRGQFEYIRDWRGCPVIIAFNWHEVMTQFNERLRKLGILA